MRICAVLALVLALIGPASAGPSADWNVSAIDVMLGCRSYLREGIVNTHEEASCVSFVKAAELLSKDYWVEKVCAPEAVTWHQKVAVVVKYLDEHPEDMLESFVLQAHTRHYSRHGPVSPELGLAGRGARGSKTRPRPKARVTRERLGSRDAGLF